VYRFIYPVKDAYIYELNTNDEKNFGGDESLVLKKDFSGKTGLNGVSRILLKFDLTEISNSIVAGDISNPSYYLRLYEKGSSEISPEYQLNAYALSASWENGTGYTTQDPNSRNGVSWEKSDETFSHLSWSVGGLSSAEISMDSASKPMELGHPNLDTGNRSKIGGGVWYDEGGSSITGVSSQSFSYQSPNIEMNVGDIVNKWLDGTRQNEGFIIKWDSNDSNMNSTSQSQEDSTSITGDISFYSMNAGSTFSPKIEVRWDDSTITSSNQYSLQSDGTDGSYVNLGANTLWSTPKASYSFWINCNVIASADTIFDKPYYYSGVAINLTTSGTSSPIKWYGEAGSADSQVSNTALSVGIWYHIAMTFDGTTAKIYINGTEDISTTKTNWDFSDSFINSSAATLGGDGGTWVIDGYLDEFAIFDIGLTANKVKEIYNGGAPTDLSDESGLVSYYRFEEGSGATVADSSGNSYDGTFVGTTTFASGSGNLPDSGSFGISLSDGTKDFYAYMRNLRETYRETENPKIRLSIRERYQTKSVSTTKKSLSEYKIRYKKGWYSIVDVETGDTLIPFGDNSKLSQDTTSNYFKLNFKGFITNKSYKIKIRIQLEDGRYNIFDDDFNFKVVS